jgi:hypothetical protein
LLGNDAYEGATAKLEALGKEFKAWEAVSRGADFPKEKLGLAAGPKAKQRQPNGNLIST